MLAPVNFEIPGSVIEYVTGVFKKCYRDASDAWLRKAFSDIEALFEGRNPEYLPNDLKYHDFKHTLMVAACMTQILEGYHMDGGPERLRRRDFELGIVGVLLHDAGYLKLRSDAQGTGAKYTYCHILRSCAFAAAYLPSTGASSAEIQDVISAINCTGATSEIGRLHFNRKSGRTLGAALATADYLAQLSDPDYPDKLGDLFAEFLESDEYANVPVEKRMFNSERELILRTPQFWEVIVKPRLSGEFLGAYHLLERPLHSGKNAYFDAIDDNFERISQRVAGLRATGS
jgi:hypothetical protein